MAPLTLLAGLVVLYNIGADRYSRWKIQEMASVQPFEVIDPTASGSELMIDGPSQLKRTVSRRTGLVEIPADRVAWNTWIQSPTGLALDGDNPIPPGTYTFTYRSNVKQDEANSIKKALFHIPTLLGFVSKGEECMVVKSDGGVVMIGHFRNLKRLTAYEIKWNGHVGSHSSGRPCIHWDGTAMVTRRLGKTTTTLNSPMSEKLRTTPWEIVKVEGGIICFRRGDSGLLAYALEEG